MLAISQPTYLPWSGYFDLIDRSEKFVFLDDVQFDSRSWQQRNRIISNKNYLLLTIPVIKKGKSDQNINEVMIKETNFYDGHLKSIEFNYSKTKYFDDYFNRIENIYKKISSNQSLVNLNIELIKLFSNILGLNIQFLKSSDLKTKGKRSEKLINICEFLKYDNYLINPGALNYLDNDKEIFINKGINVYLQNYEQKPYTQKTDNFLPNASIIDLIFNEGPNSLSVIRAGQKKSRKLF